MEFNTDPDSSIQEKIVHFEQLIGQNGNNTHDARPPPHANMTNEYTNFKYSESYRATFSCEAKHEGQMAIDVGDIITVCFWTADNSGWFWGKCREEEGWVHADDVEDIIVNKVSAQVPKSPCKFNEGPPVPPRSSSLNAKSQRKNTQQASGSTHNAEPVITLYSEINDQYMNLSEADLIYENTDALRIVMVGKTGSGKSATGNTILGNKHFLSIPSGKSITRDCKSGVSIVNGRKILVVDTPGLFDTSLTSDQVNQEILKCVQMTIPGPHIFLLILQITRFTEEEIETFNQIFGIFGKHMEQFAVVVFTRCNELEGSSLEEFIKSTDETLQRLIGSCRGGYIGLDNKARDDEKTKQKHGLLLKLNKVVEENAGKYFSNDLFTNAETLLKETIETTKQASKEAISNFQKLTAAYEKQIADVEHNERILHHDRSEQIALKNQLQAEREQNANSFTSIETSTAVAPKYKTPDKDTDLEEREKELDKRIGTNGTAAT